MRLPGILWSTLVSDIDYPREPREQGVFLFCYRVHRGLGEFVGMVLTTAENQEDCGE
jgi:hypothetical protein